jgi:hypothetical protein
MFSRNFAGQLSDLEKGMGGEMAQIDFVLLFLLCREI